MPKPGGKDVRVRAYAESQRLAREAGGGEWYYGPSLRGPGCTALFLTLVIGAAAVAATWACLATYF